MSNPNTAKRTLKPPKNKRRYNPDGEERGGASWVQIQPMNIVELIVAASEAGGAVRFGLSRDGGAYAIGVYGDGPEVYSVYSPTPEVMEEHMANLVDVFEAIKAEG